jgi:hypothetical protein
LTLLTEEADQYIPCPSQLVQEAIASLSADLSLFTKAITEAVDRVSQTTSDSSSLLPDDPPGAALRKQPKRSTHRV